jgi:hypothetical protein
MRTSNLKMPEALVEVGTLDDGVSIPTIGEVTVSHFLARSVVHYLNHVS